MDGPFSRERVAIARMANEVAREGWRLNRPTLNKFQQDAWELLPT